MVSLTCSAAATDGVTLVTARLDGTAVGQRVRLANRLDGPVWPPRREGVPEAGWDEDGVEVVVPADGTVAVGYASPAPPVESPVAVVERTVLDGDENGTGAGGDDPPTPESALRDLGDPSPPRDAIPDPTGDADEEARGSEGSEVPESPADPGWDGVPDAVEAWLDGVEDRISTAERLARAETVPEATSALREAGSLADAEALVDDLAVDADALESVTDRAERLAGRADDADVPLATLERFA